MFTGPNPIHPCHMSGGDRIAELASILAVGLVRLRLRQSSTLVGGSAHKPLHYLTEESVCRND